MSHPMVWTYPQCTIHILCWVGDDSIEAALQPIPEVLDVMH